MPDIHKLLSEQTLRNTELMVIDSINSYQLKPVKAKALTLLQ